MGRQGTLRRVGLVVLGANALLLAAKGAVWYQTGSLAVGSEAVNSLTDVVYSVIILGGLYLTTQPPDLEHPHGHERIEPFVSLFIASGIFLASIAILWSATQSILTGNIVVAQGGIPLGVLAVAAGVKFGLYRYCLRVGNRMHSPAVIATAVDNRNDILAAGAAFGGVLGAQLGMPVLDPLAAILVAGAIGYTGVGIVRDNVNYLVGAAPSDDLRTEIVRRALGHPEVESVHDVIAHYVGPEVDVSLHIEVEGDHTLLEAHDIETEVIESIQSIPEVDDVFIHVDPKELDEWKTDDDANRLIEQIGQEQSDADDE